MSGAQNEVSTTCAKTRMKLRFAFLPEIKRPGPAVIELFPLQGHNRVSDFFFYNFVFFISLFSWGLETAGKKLGFFSSVFSFSVSYFVLLSVDSLYGERG